MSTATKTAILKAKIENVVSELMVKTNAANVYVDDTTTLATRLSSIIADIATKASTTDLTNGLAGKANTSHTHAQSDITGLSTALAGKANATHTHAQSEITGLTDALGLLAAKTEVTSAIDALRQELLGDTPVDAYNTFTELAAYIAEHKEVSDALTAAIGNKADKATTLAGYGITDAYTTTQVDTKIADAISAATGGESAASVKLALENYQTSNNARVEALEADTHTHTNKSVLDGITAGDVTAWNGKSKIYYTSAEPAGLSSQDLWVQIV